MFRQYKEIGSGKPPMNNTYDEQIRQCQNEIMITQLRGRDLYRGELDGRITRKEVSDCIHKLKYGKACGMDWISTEILKTGEESLLKDLAPSCFSPRVASKMGRPRRNGKLQL